MVFACKTIRSSERSTSTPIWPRSLVIVEVSISRGTLAMERGLALSRAAHMIGSAAFFAPEIRTSPSSGRPPVILSLSICAPLLGRESAHGQRMDLLAHAPAERRINPLMALDAPLALEPARDHQGLEVLAVAHDLDALAGDAGFDSLLDALGSDHEG